MRGATPVRKQGRRGEDRRDFDRGCGAGLPRAPSRSCRFLPAGRAARHRVAPLHRRRDGMAGAVMVGAIAGVPLARRREGDFRRSIAPPPRPARRDQRAAPWTRGRGPDEVPQQRGTAMISERALRSSAREFEEDGKPLVDHDGCFLGQGAGGGVHEGRVLEGAGREWQVLDDARIEAPEATRCERRTHRGECPDPGRIEQRRNDACRSAVRGIEHIAGIHRNERGGMAGERRRFQSPGKIRPDDAVSTERGARRKRVHGGPSR